MYDGDCRCMIDIVGDDGDCRCMIDIVCDDGDCRCTKSNLVVAGGLVGGIGGGTASIAAGGN